MAEDRVLISIGCDNYAQLIGLNGAEVDARNIFNHLTNEDFGDYSPTRSKLLLSPTLTEITAVFNEILIGPAVSTLTFYFAGHGLVAHSSYFLCASDTNPAMFSTTAFSLTQLSAILNQLEATQKNLIIDACEAGGLVGDLGALIKPSLMGNAGTPSISIFAASAANEYSLDTPEGGIVTTELMRILKGEVPIQSQRPYLDLIEVGRVASKRINDMESTLSPIVWGLNLFGQSEFSKNPNYETHAGATLYQLTSIPPTSPAGLIINNAAQKIRVLYLTAGRDIDSYLIRDTLSPIVNALCNAGLLNETANFVVGASETLAELSRSAEYSVFTTIERIATCLSILLPWAKTSASATTAIQLLCQNIYNELDNIFLEMEQAEDEGINYVCHNGLPDLYYLPLRITRMLGWISAIVIAAEMQGSDVTLQKSKFKVLVAEFLNKYPGGFVAMNDEQTPYLLSLLKLATDNDWRDEAEKLAGLYFYSFHSSNGNMANSSLDDEKVFEYLTRRNANDFVGAFGLLAKPSEFFSLLLLFGNKLNLDEVFDPYLEDLDHKTFNIFLADDCETFNQGLIESGVNHNFILGSGIWRCSDLVTEWKNSCQKRAAALAAENGIVKSGMLYTSLLYPDRAPWFLIAEYFTLPVET